MNMQTVATVGTVVSCVGVATTGVLAARGAFKFATFDIPEGEEAKVFFKCFGPAIGCGLFTMGTFIAVRTIDVKTIAGLSAATAALSTRLAQTNAAIKEVGGEELCNEIGEKVDKKAGLISSSDYDIIILDPDGALYFEPITGLKFRAFSERVGEAFYKLNRNYQIRGGLATLYEWLRMLGITKHDIKVRGLYWTKYIGWHELWMGSYGYSWIDYADIEDHAIEAKDPAKYISLDFCTPLMPVCINPPDVVHMICHTEEEDLSELMLDRDDVETEIELEIRDNDEP